MALRKAENALLRLTESHQLTSVRPLSVRRRHTDRRTVTSRLTLVYLLLVSVAFLFSFLFHFCLLLSSSLLSITLKSTLLHSLHMAGYRAYSQGRGRAKRHASPLNSATIGLYTGGVCLKDPNEWHSVLFGEYGRALSATGAP